MSILSYLAAAEHVTGDPKYGEAAKHLEKYLELDPDGSIPIRQSLYFLRFQAYFHGYPIQGGSVDFRINNGNLIQITMDKVARIDLNPAPALNFDDAWRVVDHYIGGIDPKRDRVINKGSLVVLPVTPWGHDPDIFSESAPLGSGIDYALVYKLTFHRDGVMGTWQALVDAHTGNLIQFVDANR